MVVHSETTCSETTGNRESEQDRRHPEASFVLNIARRQPRTSCDSMFRTKEGKHDTQ